MPKLKLCVQNYNGILNNLLKRTDLFEFPVNVKECDCLVTWQDLRRDLKIIAEINRESIHKPHIVSQHGRSCSRDYGPPENFELMATKFCCWGQDDYEEMKKLGYGDRTVITGCPYLTHVLPKVPHRGKNILFVSARTMHEEPYNIIVFYELKKLELSHSQEVLRKHRRKLKDGWDVKLINPDSTQEVTGGYNDTIPYNDLSIDWHLISKTTEIQDKNLYIGHNIDTMPYKTEHIDECVKLLTEVDVVVCLEEGTFQVLAMMMDIPLIVVKGFELLNYAGIDYSKQKRTRTEGAEWVELSELEEAIERELTNPGRLSREREEVVRREFGGFSSDPDDNLIREIKRSIKNG